MTFDLQVIVRTVLFGLSTALLASACTGFQPAPSAKTSTAAATPAPAPVDLAPYLGTLDQLAPGDTARQSAALDRARADLQQAPTSGNRLRYALALGAAGRTGSDPVEARRLITELLASTHDLSPQELSLAKAFLREFDARVALYADLARQREELEKKLLSVDADGDRRLGAANAENQRLKKALAEAERKLEAVAEMERALAPEGQ
jgi:hypothetical protein